MPRGLRLSDAAANVVGVTGDHDIMGFTTTHEIWSWLDANHASHRGLWVHLQTAGSPHPSVTFHDLLEAGIAFGWSESTRKAFDRTSYLQKFTPRRTRGTTSQRNLAIAHRLESEGCMTPAGRWARP